MSAVNGEPESIAALRARDWDAELESTLADISDIGADEPNLHGNGAIIASLLRELDRHPLPEVMVYVPPEDRDQLDAWAYASFIVGHRAERLVQTAELTSGALRSLAEGALQVSAVAARSLLLELAVLCWDVHQQVVDPWRAVHGSVQRVRAEARSAASPTYRLLWETRMGSRIPSYTDGGWPAATNTMTRLGRIAKGWDGIDHTYAMLCDATHPNVESQATLWRAGDLRVRGRPAVEFAPARSNSPVKARIIEAVRIGCALVLPFARDLWWIAADVANTCDITPTALATRLAIPVRTARGHQCSCGSGDFTARCTHPEPQFDFAAEFGWPARPT